MRSLNDFLLNGTLPFVGRANESDRIIRFWRSTFDAYRLRAMLLSGEAGIGKSRLVEEIIPGIVAAGGAVVHTRLYAESATSLVPLVAQALWHPDAGRALLAREPDETLGSVAAALRRVSRLRPTLLIIEDIHLLGGDALREFAGLLNTIADETLSLLCLGRTVALEARPVLEPYLTEEFELRGLLVEDYREMWKRMMGSDVETTITSTLYNATSGNPLALRSAVRGVVRAGMVEHDPVSDSWHMTGSLRAFYRNLKQNVALLAEGMTAHLEEGEKLAARQLACLGEIFSREAAEALFDNAAAAIEALTSRGIIVQAGTGATPLAGGKSRFPVLVFTHNLLHHRLIDGAPVDPDRLIRVIAGEFPLYSILPFQLLCNHGTNRNGDPAQEQHATEIAIGVALAIDATPDWRLKDLPLSAAVVIIEDGRGAMGGGDTLRPGTKASESLAPDISPRTV